MLLTFSMLLAGCIDAGCFSFYQHMPAPHIQLFVISTYAHEIATQTRARQKLTSGNKLSRWRHQRVGITMQRHGHTLTTRTTPGHISNNMHCCLYYFSFYLIVSFLYSFVSLRMWTQRVRNVTMWRYTILYMYQVSGVAGFPYTNRGRWK